MKSGTLQAPDQIWPRFDPLADSVCNIFSVVKYILFVVVIMFRLHLLDLTGVGMSFCFRQIKSVRLI